LTSAISLACSGIVIDWSPITVSIRIQLAAVSRKIPIPRP
jgi:hypothetical protein